MSALVLANILLLTTNTVGQSCETLNLTNAQCAVECSYYNDENIYYNFIQYNDITQIATESNITNVNFTLLSQTLRWYTLSTYPHQYYPNVEPEMCSYSIGTYCAVQQSGLMYGFCIPTHCNNHYDATQILKSNEPFQKIINATNASINCDKMPRKLDAWTYTFIAFLSIYVVFIIVCTCMKYFQYNYNSTIINSFAIQNNFKSFIKTRGVNQSQYNFCDGLRLIAAYWVVIHHLGNRTVFSDMSMNRPSTLGHGINTLWPPIQSDNIYTNKWSHYVRGNFFWNSVPANLASMLIFFWLSGFFGAYSMIRILKKWKRKNTCHYIQQTLLLYLKRYLRLIPLIMFLVLFNLFIYDDIPFSYTVNSRNERRTVCKKSWWSIMFLFNNIHRAVVILSDKFNLDICVNGVWYVCAEMQIYLYLPVICFLYVDYGHLSGLVSCAVPILVTNIVRLYFAGYYNFYETPYSWGADVQNDGNQNEQSYRMPYAWFAHYYLGTFTYLLFIHKFRSDKFKFNMHRVLFCGLLTLSIVLLCTYSFVPYSDYYNWPHKKWNVATTSFYYYVFAGQIYCLGLGLFVFCLRCTPIDYYSIAKRFLSCNACQVMAKLTYGIYMWHNPIQRLWELNLDYPFHFNWIDFFILFVASCVVATLVAFVTWITIENP
eukprot:254628_1